jgi:hypothetical protein
LGLLAARKLVKNAVVLHFTNVADEGSGCEPMCRDACCAMQLVYPVNWGFA